MRRFAHRLAGERGSSTVKLAGDAIRGVALGVGVTALVQAILGGIALAIVDIPFAGLLSALMFMLCIAQVGPAPVLVPAVVWIFYAGQIGWGIVLAIATLGITLLDNVLRPALIRIGADLPLLLIFAGVIGGLLAFGLAPGAVPSERESGGNSPGRGGVEVARAGDGPHVHAHAGGARGIVGSEGTRHHGGDRG